MAHKPNADYIKSHSGPKPDSKKAPVKPVAAKKKSK